MHSVSHSPGRAIAMSDEWMIAVEEEKEECEMFQLNERPTKL